ncbi:MAG: glycosyltransferase family 4 protein [Desulfovermiculus sp.]|nr:glycosyltransferase family 4 protein [Desulfovermiculus sp.]
MSVLRIGHASQQYPEKRNIIGKVENATYCLCRDYYSLRSRVKGFLRFTDSHSDQEFNNQFRFNDFGLNRVDCLHLFNSVNYSSTPWVATFETCIPRFRNVLKHRNDDPKRIQSNSAVYKAVYLLAKNKCISTIAISRSAYEIQEQFLDLFPDAKPTIMQKTKVVHPPQILLTADANSLWYPCETKSEISFMLVGHQFFRKGGIEIIQATKELRDFDNVPVKLCIVSGLKNDEYATKSGFYEKEWVLNFIEKNESWIKYHPFLPYEKVLKKIFECDVGLLPSYAETYGYSVLEFQAAARPVITTNIRAFPEINNDQCGWVIPVAKKEIGGEAYYHSAEDRAKLSNDIRHGLLAVIRQIASNPALVREKGIQAWNRIKKEHDPATYSTKLESIYQRAIQR